MNTVPMKQDRSSYKDVAIRQSGGGGMLMPQTFGDAVAFSEIMARAQHAIPKHLRDVPGACLAVTMQALRWEMDPFAVASKSYNVKDIIAYEAQLIAAVVHTRAPIATRPDYVYTGEGQDRRCTVSAKFDDGVTRSYESPKIADITVKNSPLWKADPDQQLAYYSIRAFARRYCPEVILGVYTPEEAETFRGPDNARDVTPRQSLSERLQGPNGAQGFSQSHVVAEIGGETNSAATEGGTNQEITAPENLTRESARAGEPSGQAGGMPATESNSPEHTLPMADALVADQDGAATSEATGLPLAGSSALPASPGADDGDGGATDENPRPGASPSLPQGTLILYANALRRAQKKESLNKLAKAFWDERGGWDAVKATSDGEVAAAIFNAFRDNFGNKDAIDRELRELI